MLKSVTSPAGESIEVISDAEFLSRLGASDAPQNSRSLMLSTVATTRWAYLRALWYLGEALDAEHGQATGIVFERAGEFGLPMSASQSSFSSQLRDSARDPLQVCIDRELRSVKRTRRIWLARLPESWARFLIDETQRGDYLDEIEHVLETEPSADSDSVPTPEPVSDAALVADGLGASSAIEIELASAVATALLAQVVEIVSTKGVDGINGAAELHRLQLDYAALSERLGTQVSYVEKLRRELREVGDELHALKHERDGLRKELRSTQHNLKVATSKDSQRIIQAEVDRQVAQLMRSTPVGANSRVAAHEEAVAS